ncbi:MAG TPA: Ig-like domain repeat protein [Gemmataceae bacterium]
MNAVTSPNQFGDGVRIDGGGSNNWIGKEVDAPKGTITTAANVISGNANAGIIIDNGNSNKVVGNFIGLLKDGKTKSPTAQQFGIKITGDSSGNAIGGTAASDKNTVSGNIKYGVQVDSAGATGNQINGNNIGTANDGTNVDGGNGDAGIIFTNMANANTVHSNWIKYNGGPGVLKTNVGTKQNLVFDPNSIAFNGSGIDDGANDGPILNSATVSGNTIAIQGTLTGDPNTSYYLEFFGNTTEDPSGYGEGEFYLGSTTVTTDGNGNSSINATVNAIYGSYVSATATNTATGGFTTAFSNDVAISGESQTATVSGNVWDDTNLNGLLDKDIESGVATVNVQLFTSVGSLVASTTTDATGNYLFTNVAPGDYYLQFAAPSGYMFTAPYQGDDTIDSHADLTTGDTEQFSLIAGEDDPFINAGLIPTSAQPTTSTAVTSDLNPSAYGTPITFTATVTQTDSIPLGGTVTFEDGSTVLGTVELDGTSDGYQAVFTAGNLSLGDHNIQAIYNGDGFHLGSSASMTQTVEQAPTATSVTSSNDPALPGQPVTFTASVFAAYGTPTGTVTFEDGSTVLGTATLDANDNATFTTSSLTAGSHAITAVYGGDDNFTGSSGTLTQVISQETISSMSLSSSANPATPNQSVTFTATVSGNSGTPTGTVTFEDGDTVLGTAPLNSGSAALTVSALALGSQDIIALYSGDTTYASNAASLTQTVNLASTAVFSVTSSANPSQSGQTVTFAASVLHPNSSGTPTGSVTFYANNTVLGTGTLNAGGAATFTTSTLPSGNYTIEAVYGGDGNFAGSMGTLNQWVEPTSNGTSTTSLGSSANPAAPNQPVTFTAMVLVFGPFPTGTVTFYDGTTVLGTATLSPYIDYGGGQHSSLATFTTSALTLGVHNILAVYDGDSSNASSVGFLTQTVSLAATTSSLTSSSNPSPLGQEVTFTATVAAVDPSMGTPTGTVSFYDGTTLLGVGTLSVVNGKVQATFTTAAMGLGSHTILAIYTGDSTFADSGGSLEQSISS